MSTRSKSPSSPARAQRNPKTAVPDARASRKAAPEPRRRARRPYGSAMPEVVPVDLKDLMREIDTQARTGLVRRLLAEASHAPLVDRIAIRLHQAGVSEEQMGGMRHGADSLIRVLPEPLIHSVQMRLRDVEKGALVPSRQLIELAERL